MPLNGFRCDACQVRHLKVACVSIPEAGHLVPTVEVAKALARRGHAASLITMASAAPKFAAGCEAVRCRFVGLVPHMTGSDAGHGHTAELMARGLMAQAFVGYAKAMEEELREVLTAERPDVLVVDFATFFALDVAKELSIPCILNVPGWLSSS